MEIKSYSENKNIIERIEKNSIAEELGIEKGDILLAIDNNEVKDIIDYKYLISGDYIVVTIQKKNGEIWDFEIEKNYDEDLGIIFSNPLIDKAKSCRNKCIFCFIDQLPKNMRKTLYFKDDDSRLSFLQGNFITLTNMSENDIQKIIKYRLSPINISVHTTNPELRIKMLNNKNAGKIYSIIKKFSDAGIQMNCQIVLVPTINDGEELIRTLNDLQKLYPQVKSIAIVPVGLTKYREGLADIKTYDYESANKLLTLITSIQDKFLHSLGTRLVFPSDEFFVLAKRNIPSLEYYEGFPQLENGVGLMRNFEEEISNSIKTIKEIENNNKYTVATGVLAYDYMKNICKKITNKSKGLKINVVAINNEFFGEKITVSGLITGRDLINQLKQLNVKNDIIIPECMLKRDEKIFLDDVTVEQVENELDTKVIVSKVNGNDFLNIFCNKRGE